MTEPLWTGTDWSFPLIEKVYEEIEKIGIGELGLDLYPNQIEIISSEQMLELYANIAMPTYYDHWSFGKRHAKDEESYKSGATGLAYEIVANMNPCINYLMEDNTMMTQALVMAHAGCGHNFFFKNNYLFKTWTDADSIVDYLVFAKDYIAKVEQIEGRDVVEAFLDSCHALMDYGVNRYKRPSKLSLDKEKKKQREREEYLQSQVNDLYRILPDEKSKRKLPDHFPKHPEENILYFCEKYAPSLKTWERELIRIVRKIAQYFYPQSGGQCLTGNHLVSTKNGILRLDEIITEEGYIENNGLSLLTAGDLFTNTSHTYLRKKQKVMRITTETGKVFIGTPEHPLTVLEGDKHVLKNLEDMTSDDYLVIHTDYQNISTLCEPTLLVPLNCSFVTCEICGLESGSIASHITQKHDMNILDYKNTFDKNKVTSDSHGASKSKYVCSKYPEKMSPELSELFSYIKYCYTSNIDVSQSIFNFVDGKIDIDRVKELLFDLFGISVPVKLDPFDRNTLNFSSFTLKEYIKINCVELLANDGLFLIPKIIRQSSKNSIISYLRVLFDYKAIKRSDISTFYLTSYNNVEELLQIQTILTSMGIISNVKTCEQLFYMLLNETEESKISVKKLKYTLAIHSEFKDKFRIAIGTNLKEYKTSVKKYRQVSSNVIPSGKERLTSILNILRRDMKDHLLKTELEMKTDTARMKKMGLLLRQTFPRIEEFFTIESKELKQYHIETYPEKFESLKKIQNINGVKELINLIEISKGIYYDKIVKIEAVEELHDVYDVTIPENHLFWVNGVISHNTQVANEGSATFTHYTIMNRLHEKGLTTDGAHMEFLALHSNVLTQPSWDKPYYNGINPYKLGFEIFRDIERICVKPTEEDKIWFPDLANQNSWEVIKDAMANYRDESFIRQFLSPKLIRDLRLFQIKDERTDDKYVVTAIHDEKGYQQIRTMLADQHEREVHVPRIEVITANPDDRSLTLLYTPLRGRKLSDPTRMLEHVKRLWGYTVKLTDKAGMIKYVQ